MAEDLAQTLGLVFLWWAWTFYRRWLDEGLSFHLFASGLVLGAAVYTTPIALPLGLFFALGLGLFRRLEPPAWAAASLVLLFPSSPPFSPGATSPGPSPGKPPSSTQPCPRKRPH